MKTAGAIPSAPGAVPFMGHALLMVRDPLGFVSSLPAHGDLVRIRLGPQSAVMVCDPVLTRQVLLEDCTFDKGGPLFVRLREVLGDGVGTCPHGRHRRQRRLVQPAFRLERFPGYAAVIGALAEAAACSWHDGQVIDVIREMTTLTARTTAETMFTAALPPEAVQLVVDDTSTLVEGIFRRMITPPLLDRVPTRGNRRYHQALARLRRMIGAIIAVRRTDGGDHGDLLSSLLSASDPESRNGHQALTDEELTDQAITFLFAGTETTASTLAWALHLLAGHPEVEECLHSEAESVLAGAPPAFTHLPALKVAGCVVTETLRLYPPAWLMTRTAMKDTELGGVTLPAGSTIAYSPYLIHRRPDLYENPDHFDPGRWLAAQPDRTAYLPFSAGARQCIGDRFAVTEATLALTAIARRWRLVPLTDRPIRPYVKTTLSPRGLRMCVVARSSAPGGVANGHEEGAAP